MARIVPTRKFRTQIKCQKGAGVQEREAERKAGREALGEGKQGRGTGGGKETPIQTRSQGC